MAYFFHPEAASEHLLQIAWYEQQSSGLGKRYIDAFSKAMQNACSRPESFPIYSEPDIRRVLFRDFPYTVFFREKNAQIEVLAVAAHKRQPGYWLTRA